MINLAYQLIKNCEKMPNKICLIEKDTQVTYAELYNLVANFKDNLKSKGIKQGDKVLVLVPMSIHLYVTLLSIWSIGAIPCFMDAGFIKNGLKKNQFDDINSIVGTTKYILYSQVNENLKKLKIKIDVKQIKKTPFSRKLTVEEVEKNFPGILTYTSGTTGVPKIAERTHEFLKNQGNILKQIADYEEKDRELSTIPIFTLSNIYVGITTVIANGNFTNLGKSNPRKLVKQIRDKNINRIMASPGLLQVITNYCIDKDIKLKDVKKIYTGGGAVFLDLIKKLQQVFENATIHTIYGSTEAEPIAILHIENMTKQDIKDTENGKGILAGEIVGVEECKIIKPQKEPIGTITKNEFLNMQTREVGEIVVTGTNVLKGYVGGIGDKENKFKVEDTIYHRTGDMGQIDEKGRLWLRGRIKEPYFHIEAVLHAKFAIGKTAVFENDSKLILVLENHEKTPIEEIKKAIPFEKIDEIKYVSKIPVDKRHSTKVDYNELRKILNI